MLNMAAGRMKPLALAQPQSQDESDDMELGASAAAVYKTHSTGILNVLEDMREIISQHKKSELNSDIAKMTAKIDQAVAKP
eukprot:346294-Heterocapsa_arctica.AAC.1